MALSDIQEEARVKKNHEVQGTLFESLMDVLSKGPELKTLSDKHDKVVEEFRMRLKNLHNFKNQFSERPAWQEYQRAQSRLKECESHIHECFDALNKFHDEESKLNAFLESEEKEDKRWRVIHKKRRLMGLREASPNLWHPHGQ